MAIEFKPLHQHFAAEVQGFDMRQPIDAATARDVRAGDRPVTASWYSRAQQVDDAQQLAFTANFGPPDIGRKKAVKSADSRIPEEMIDLSNLDENGYVIDPEPPPRAVAVGHAAVALRQFLSAAGGEVFDAARGDGAAVGRRDRIRRLPRRL